MMLEMLDKREHKEVTAPGCHAHVPATSTVGRQDATLSPILSMNLNESDLTKGSFGHKSNYNVIYIHFKHS